MPRLRDPRQEELLERDGYVVVENFLSRDEVSRLQQLFRANDLPAHHSAFGVTMFSTDVSGRTAIDRGIRDVTAPHAEQLMNGYRYCFSNFLVKEPQRSGPAGEVQLHQDFSFVDESQFQSLGVWTALVDTNAVNGCLQVIPGSHRLNPAPRAAGFPYPYREMDALLAKKLRLVPMKAGDAMIFCQKLFHASSPNRSDATRLASGGLFVPQSAQLYCYYRNPAAPSRVDVFEVDDQFYTRYPYGIRPEGVPRVSELEYWYAPISPAQLAS